MKVQRGLPLVFVAAILVSLHSSIGPVQLVRIDKGPPGLEEILKAGERVNDQLATEPRYIDRGIASEIWHFYVITAVGQDGVESNFSREVEVPPVPPKQGGE